MVRKNVIGFLRRHGALLSVILIVTLFFITKWVLQGAYFQRDLVINTVPLENLYGQLQRLGQSPLWAPELASGYPLLAGGQLGFWYPPHMVLRQFLSGVWTLNLSLWLHALLAAVGMFVWLKHNKLGSQAAATAGVVLPLCAAFVGKYSSLNLILPFMWAPLLLWLLQRFWEHMCLKRWVWWVGATTCCVLVGHPQMALYVLILQALFAGCLLGLQWRRWPRLLALVPGVLLVLGLASFYLFPIITGLPESDRATGTLHPNAAGHFDYEFTPATWLGLVVPHPFGHEATYHGATNEAELSAYIGPVALIMAIVGLCIGRRRYPVLWLVAVVLIVVGGALAVGSYLPFFPWLVAHGFTYFNAPSRFFLYATIGLVLGVAMGLETLRSYWKYIAAVLVITPLFWASWVWHHGVPWRETREPVLAQQLGNRHQFTRIFSGAVPTEQASDNDFGIKAGNPVCDTCTYRQTFTSPFPTISGIAVKFADVHPATGSVVLRVHAISGELLREAQVPVTEIRDSEWITFEFASAVAAADQPFYFELTSTVPREQAPRLLIHTNPHEQYDPTGQLLNCPNHVCVPVQQADAAFKVTAHTAGLDYYQALAPYVSAGFGVGTMQWAGSLPLAATKQYLAPLGTWGDPWQAGARAILNRASTTHFIGLFPPYRYAAADAGLSLEASAPFGDQFLRLYKNNEAFSRAQFVGTVKALRDPLDQVNTIKRLSATDQMVVTADLPSDAAFTTSHSTADITIDTRTRVAITTKNEDAGFLVLRDVLTSGWVATIDGQLATIYRVDGLFRGVLVPAGNHEVFFVYQPAWLKPALRVEVVALLLFAGLAVFGTLGAWKK